MKKTQYRPAQLSVPSSDYLVQRVAHSSQSLISGNQLNNSNAPVHKTFLNYPPPLNQAPYQQHITQQSVVNAYSSTAPVYVRSTLMNNSSTSTQFNPTSHHSGPTLPPSFVTAPTDTSSGSAPELNAFVFNDISESEEGSVSQQSNIA